MYLKTIISGKTLNVHHLDWLRESFDKLKSPGESGPIFFIS